VPAPMVDDDQPPLIALDDRQEAAVDLEGLIGLARATLLGEGIADAELSISLVTEAEIAELHERYLHEAGPTDVLSFPLDEVAGEDGLRQVGDVVIAPAVAARNNPDDPAAELRLLLVHGILHLLGHDHMSDGDKGEMWARQERYSGIHVP
jgi:probable rRNA maturation factor